MYHYTYESKRKSRFTGIHFSVLLFIVLLIFFLYMVTGISDDAIERQEASLSSALNRAIVSCYCVEGTYPPNLNYIEEHYGLLYDSDVFFVDYRPIGSNIYPEVAIIRKGGE